MSTTGFRRTKERLGYTPLSLSEKATLLALECIAKGQTISLWPPLIRWFMNSITEIFAFELCTTEYKHYTPQLAELKYFNIANNIINEQLKQYHARWDEMLKSAK